MKAKPPGRKAPSGVQGGGGCSLTEERRRPVRTLVAESSLPPLCGGLRRCSAV